MVFSYRFCSSEGKLSVCWNRYQDTSMEWLRSTQEIKYRSDAVTITWCQARVTRWSFSAPLDCNEAIIDHNPPITTSQCGQFTFENVTVIMIGSLLSSTAVATANAPINVMPHLPPCGHTARIKAGFATQTSL